VQDWELTRLRRPNPGFQRYEKTLFRALFGERDTVRLADLRESVGPELRGIQTQLYEDMVKRGWYDRSPEEIRRSVRRRAIKALIAAIAVTALLAVFTHAALLGVGLIAAAAAFLALSGRHPARTGRGSAMLERLRGFRHYVETVEAEQIPFQERVKYFSEFLPYAMVFGMSERWTKLFADLDEPLYWYRGRDGLDVSGMLPGLRSFATMTAGTLAIAATSLPSSTPSSAGLSGFSGGFSGGGAGGGGGGSW
jgi:uncharacterized membrane protein YgcG